jgi:hypothetical protein
MGAQVDAPWHASGFCCLGFLLWCALSLACTHGDVHVVAWLLRARVTLLLFVLVGCRAGGACRVPHQTLSSELF